MVERVKDKRESIPQQFRSPIDAYLANTQPAATITPKAPKPPFYEDEFFLVGDRDTGAVYSIPALEWAENHDDMDNLYAIGDPVDDDKAANYPRYYPPPPNDIIPPEGIPPTEMSNPFLRYLLARDPNLARIYGVTA